ncbi:MAG: glycosyltransferase [Chitinivibrionales bacterium]|nr:glycosyltransferase [Chitinivibrionales bacterium]MBD3396876.1 glycosyltransferase [Chitinivibrionales bacterium]
MVMALPRCHLKKISPDMSSWFVVVPPDGAARMVGLEVVRAFDQCAIAYKAFKTGIFLREIRGHLRDPDDTLVVDLLNQSLAVSCLDFAPTHMLVLALAPVTLFTLKLLQRQRITTAHWFYEDYRRVPSWRTVLEGYDHFAAIQRGPLPSACAAAASRYHFLHTAVMSPSLRAPDEPRTHDVAFVGVPSRHRVEVLEHLAENGLRMLIAGHGWHRYAGPLRAHIVDDTWVSPERTASFLARSRVGIDIPFHVPVARDPDTAVSPRVYNVLAAGAELVCEDVPQVHEVLDMCSFTTFTAPAGARDAVRRALDAFDTRAAEREANRRQVADHHTYARRVSRLVSRVETGDAAA